MLTISYTGVCGVLKIPEILTSGMVGKKIFFEFSSAWDGLRKTAVYRAGDIIRAEPCEAGENTIPTDVLAQQGSCLYVGIYGERGDGTIVIPTIFVKGPPIQRGADPLQAPVGDKPVSAYDHLQVQIDALKKSVTGGASATYDETTGELTISGNSVTYIERTGELLI